jgi:hypothetical protein
MARSKWILGGKAIAPMTIAVEVEKLSKEHDSLFKQVHANAAGCMGRIGKKSYCKACAKEVPSDEIGIAFAQVKKEGKDGKPSLPDIPFSKDERKAANPAIPAETFEVLSFIPAPALKYFTGVHRMVTAQGDNAAYVSALALLYKGMKDAKLVALLRYADNGTTYNAVLDEGGLLHEIYFADEVGNEADNVSLSLVSAASDKFTPQMNTMAKKMILANADKTGAILSTLVDTATATITTMAMEKRDKGIMTLPVAASQPVVDPTADLMKSMMANLALAGVSVGDEDEAAPVAAPVKAKKAAKK